MNFLDIVGMSAGNLWRRKLRSVLTILSVVIGVTALVVMLSLGFGLKKAMMDEAASYGNLTQIQVNSWGTEGGQKILNDSLMEEIMTIPGVESVEPLLEMSMTMTCEKYSCYTQLYGASQNYLSQIPIGQGTIPENNGGQLQLLMGNAMLTNFYVTSTGSYVYWDKGELPAIDLMKDNLFSKFESVYQEDTTGNYVEIPGKKNLFPVVGIVEGEATVGTNQYSYAVYTDIDSLKAYLKKNYRGQQIPGQPLDKNNKPYKELAYSELIVNAEDRSMVEDVMKTINDMGYTTYSNQEWIEQVESEFRIIEAVLGGIGAISLLVAAIGIANTMMMSTYERTKEIGVMKVLGCSLGNIRFLFLSEAAFIGFFGGILGLAFSFILSCLINMILPGMMEMDGIRISVIPLWLALISVVFSTIIGMVAGFFPAQRATKLSPLAAIRNE